MNPNHKQQNVANTMNRTVLMAAIAGERQMFDGDEKEKTKLHEKPYTVVIGFVTLRKSSPLCHFVISYRILSCAHRLFSENWTAAESR